MKRRKPEGWYDVSFIGGLVTSLYAMVPVYIVYIDGLGLLTLPARVFAIGGMVFVSTCVMLVRKKGGKLFAREDKKKDNSNGFTLVELLVVISIIGILAAIMFPAYYKAREAAYVSRTKLEMRQIATALEMYVDLYNNYPPDADRDLPSGVQAYLSGGNWPKAPWPGSVYDWDNWAPADLTYAPQQQVYQISIRFCPLGQPTQCQFPNEPWAAGFDYYSSVYYCVQGPCRAHASQPTNHPAYCVNC